MTLLIKAGILSGYDLRTQSRQIRAQRIAAGKITLYSPVIQLFGSNYSFFLGGGSRTKIVFKGLVEYTQFLLDNFIYFFIEVWLGRKKARIKHSSDIENTIINTEKRLSRRTFRRNEIVASGNNV